MSRAVLVIAKAPVAGEAKTRLAPRFGPRGAAQLAAAALIDTLSTALHVPHSEVVIAHTGDFAAAERRDELDGLLPSCIRIEQRGESFGERLANAHLDTTAMGFDRLVQIGMDTPQLTASTLADALAELDPAHRRCVLGDAADGGWWAFGTALARGARSLANVPMSQADTARRTRTTLSRSGLRVHRLATMTDVDHPADVDEVARLCAPDSAFARTAAAVTTSTAAAR
ncbi:TIGR04282 family arsenosugar biosynthesis glycosyltransferase [Gordonia sp. NPDC003424]